MKWTRSARQGVRTIRSVASTITRPNKNTRIGGVAQCPLSGVKRTCHFALHMSVFDGHGAGPLTSLVKTDTMLRPTVGAEITEMLLRHIVTCYLVFVVSAAVAQTSSPVRGGAKLRSACAGDLQRFCADVQPGGGRLIQCLSSHTRELSEVCGSMISAAGGTAKLRLACAGDLQRFCSDVRQGGGRLIQCLSSHARELSAECENMVAAMHPRRDTANSSSQSPATEPAAPVPAVNPPAPMGSILRASCGPDAQRLCAGARREIDVLKCLDSQRMKLSTVCSSYFQKLGARPTAPNKKPSSLPPTPLAKPPANDKPESGPG